MKGPIEENCLVSAEECQESFNAKKCIERVRGSRQLVLLVVFFALLLDNMLMTVIGKTKQRLLELRLIKVWAFCL